MLYAVFGLLRNTVGSDFFRNFVSLYPLGFELTRSLDPEQRVTSFQYSRKYYNIRNRAISQKVRDFPGPNLKLFTFQELLLAPETEEEEEIEAPEVKEAPPSMTSPSRNIPVTSDEIPEIPATNSNMLRVPASGYGQLGAIPRRPFSRDSSAESNSSNTGPERAAKLADITKTCFCGHYTEVRIRILGVFGLWMYSMEFSGMKILYYLFVSRFFVPPNCNSR